MKPDQTSTERRSPKEVDPLRQSKSSATLQEELEIQVAGNPDVAEGDRHEVELCLEHQAPESTTRH